MAAFETQKSVATLIAALPYPAVSCLVDNITRVDQLLELAKVNATFGSCVRSRLGSFASVVIGRRCEPIRDSSLAVGHNVDDAVGTWFTNAEVGKWYNIMDKEADVLTPTLSPSHVARVTICAPTVKTALTMTTLRGVLCSAYPRSERVHVTIERRASYRAHVLLGNLYKLLEGRWNAPPVEILLNATSYSWSRRILDMNAEEEIAWSVFDTVDVVAKADRGVHLEIRLVCKNRVTTQVRRALTDYDQQKILASLGCSATMSLCGDVLCMEFPKDSTRRVRIHFLTRGQRYSF